MPPATRADGLVLLGMILAAAIVWFPTSAIGMLLLAPLEANTDYLQLVPGLVVVGVGTGVAVSVSTTVAMETVAPMNVGSASAVLGMAGFLGGAIGFACAAALFDAFAGPGGTAALNSGDPTAIADGVSGSLYALCAITFAATLVPLVTFRRRPAGRTQPPSSQARAVAREAK